MNGHFLVGLATKDLARHLVESDLEIGGTTLRVFPYRKRAERIVVAGLPGFVDDFTIVNALSQYGRVTSIAPILIKLGEFAFNDGRREAFILLHEGVRLETLPARLTIQSKGDTLSAYLSFGIKCSKCGRQGHRRASCPSLARRNFDAPKRVDSPAQIQASSPSPTVPQRTGPPSPVPSPPAPLAPSEEAPNNAPVTPAAAAPGAPALHPARPLLPPGEAPSSTCSASDPPTTPALPPPVPAEPMEVAHPEEEGTGSTQEGKNKIRKELDACLRPAPSTIFDKTNQAGLEKERRTALYELVQALLRPAPAPSRDFIIGFTIASINARGLAIRNKSLSLCHLLRQHRVDIALVQETNTHHLDGAQDLCLGYDAITAPPDAISGSGLACIYAPGVTVLRHRILWPGHIVLATFNVHGQEMTVINVHLSHDQRERIEQLRVIEAAAVEEEEEAWVLGDFNIRDDRNRDSISMAALGALCESAALLDAAPEFDAAHLPTRVAAHGDLIESSRLDRILAPARFLEVSTSYAIAPFHLSDHRMVLLRVGPPAAPSQPRVAATLRSGLAQEHMNNYLMDIAEEISLLDAPQLWDRWTLIKAGILAEARSLHDPRHHDRDDSYIGRAQRYIRVQLEASSTNADYPSLSDLARLTRHRRPAVTTIRDENGEVIEALDIFRPRFARQSCDPAEYAAFIGATDKCYFVRVNTQIQYTRAYREEDPLHRAEVSEAEVAAAIRRLPRGRAPGWDGLPCEVLSTFEEFFAVALRRVLAESQLRGALPPSMRRSEICLVPKARGGDRGLDGYRPISLPSADYRVIGSILLGRLRPHLPTLVPECQTYAVPGRSPSWNIARVTDAVEEATARGTPLAAVSVDLQSAFDSLDRGYLISLLVSHLRLPPAFVGWILLLYARADATIRVGGFQTVAFKLLNGVRQGCALSAALFSIATGPLLRRLETILGVGNVIAYADDIVLLIHRDEQFARAAAIFESFHRASGIAVNYSKSAGLWCSAWRDRGDSPLRGASWSNSSIQVLGTRIATRSSVHHLHAYLPEASIISKLQARVARFIWGPDHTAWLASGILARPVVTGGLGLIDIGTQLHLACLKGVQVALRGGRNGLSWLVTSEAWLRPPPDGTTLQPRRLRLLKLWEETSGVLSLDHRAAPTTQLLDLPIIGGFRFLRPPNLLAPSRWVGARVRDLGDDDHHTIVTPHPTRSALADAAALAAFCRRIVAENIQASYRVPSLAEAVVLRGTTKPLARITTRSARRALDRPRLAALPIHRLLARWTPTVDVPPRVDWTSLRRSALSGHNADVALRLALHALPHPDHPASAGPSCPACGSSDGSLGHRYWGCRTIRPLILEAFNIIGRPPDLQAWIFGTGLEQDDISILSNANSPAGDGHANPAAARGDVTAPKTAASTSATSASPASLNWADSEMAEVNDNEGFIVVKGKKRRLGSTSPEHAARQPNKPGNQRSSQQQKRPTGPRAVPPQEIKATRANIADARARQATTNHENYVFVELCPDIPDYSYLKAMSTLLGGPRSITQFHRMNGHFIVGLADKKLANRLVADGLEIEGTSLRVFPFRKRAERIVVANLPGFVEDSTIVNTLGQFGKVTSIAPILVKMGEFTFTDGRREAFILLRDGVRLETLPTRLTIHSKGDTLSAFLSFGIKCSKCDPPEDQEGPARSTAPMNHRVATINARGLATRGRSLALCHLLKQHHVDIAFVQETNAFHLGSGQDLCLGYSAVILAHPVAISGSGLACVFGPGVAVLRQRILWPGHIVLATIDVHGEEMTAIAVHLAHEPRERNRQLELLAATAAQEEEGACWIIGDFNIGDRGPSSSSSSDALAALLDLAALVDVATQFDAAHLPTRVAMHGDQVESNRLDRILVPAGVLDRVSIYATSHYHLSDHRLVLLQVGPPTTAVSSPTQPRLAAMLRSGLALEHLAGYIRELEEDAAHDDDDGTFWDRWTSIKAGLLAEARSLHDPRHAASDSYVYRARRYIAAQLEASSIRADYPSLPDLARAIRLRRPVSVIRDDDDNVIEGPELRRRAFATFRPRFARPTTDPAAGAAFIASSAPTTTCELSEEDPLHRPDISPSEIANAIEHLRPERPPAGTACRANSSSPSTRPVALPSADYRVLAAILHRRLKPHLRTLVPECQTYAVPGRSPSWSIAKVTDAVEEATAMGAPLAVMGVDLESAFDSLDRGFLESLMTSLHLPPAFMGWINILYAGADATIRAGGFHTTAFPLLNGLRQGCAVSAALFSIATGPLLRRLELTLGVGNVSAYADDIVLLFHRDEEFERVATVLEDFKRASGIAVNLGKSAGLWCGAWRNRGDSPLGASWSTTSIRVLGLDIAPRSSVAHQEQHLLALLESACRRWTPFTRGLSLVGRARAANSLVGSTIQHHLHGYLPSPPTIAKLQARLARFVWGPEHTAWLPAAVMARPVAIGGLGLLDLATQLQLACLKGVQVALRGGRNGFDWLVASGSEAWIRPPPDGTRLQPRRLRLLKLWEEASKILSLNHRAVPASLLLDIPIIGGCRFLRPPDLLAPARWRGARVRDLLAEGHLTARPTRSALADAAALGAFCRRLTSENAVGFGAESAPSSSSLAAAVVLRGTATPFLNGFTTRSARRALDRPRLAATPISRFTSRWSPTIGPPPSRIDWASLRRCAHSGHEADAALKLALHALPHPAHPASVGPSCPACGSIDRSLGHRYWCCRSIRPLIREAFNIIGRPPDLQAWIFGGSGLEDDALSILASAKLRIYRYFVQVGLGEAVEDPLIAWSRTLQRRGFLSSSPL
ncbi:hypothetical protein LAZ67_2006488 [Cordylochernes scorpioides]|uniref:Reverse transcriptase n=1 Tax=Cordylochernes scorpioides TaxID=51811 RepID=A0ABY6K8P7_9ARAC|nr:hypothetical protein LAZ67_2006488 [Cordylochernes scorpioides]